MGWTKSSYERKRFFRSSNRAYCSCRLGSRSEFLVNRMSIHGGAPKPYFTVQNGELVLHNEPVPRMASSSRDIGWVRSVLGHSYLVQYAMTRLNLLQWWAVPIPGKYEISNDEAVDVGCLLMRRLGELRDRHNIPVAVVFQYSGPEVMDAALAWEKDRDRIIGCAERARLEIVDIGPERPAVGLQNRGFI